MAWYWVGGRRGQAPGLGRRQRAPVPWASTVARLIVTRWPSLLSASGFKQSSYQVTHTWVLVTTGLRVSCHMPARLFTCLWRKEMEERGGYLGEEVPGSSNWRWEDGLRDFLFIDNKLGRISGTQTHRPEGIKPSESSEFQGGILFLFICTGKTLPGKRKALYK